MRNGPRLIAAAPPPAASILAGIGLDMGPGQGIDCARLPPSPDYFLRCGPCIGRNDGPRLGRRPLQDAGSLADAGGSIENCMGCANLSSSGGLEPRRTAYQQ